MKKIVDFEICDIVPYSNGIIFAKKEMLDDNRCKVTFYGYDIKLSLIHISEPTRPY